MTLSECCQTYVDTDIMVCSCCKEHLGDEDIYDDEDIEDDEVIKYTNPKNKLEIEWDVVPVRWSNGVPFGGTNSATKEMYMEKMMEIESTCTHCGGTGIEIYGIAPPMTKLTQRCSICDGRGTV